MTSKVIFLIPTFLFLAVLVSLYVFGEKWMAATFALALYIVAIHANVTLVDFDQRTK